MAHMSAPKHASHAAPKDRQAPGNSVESADTAERRDEASGGSLRDEIKPYVVEVRYPDASSLDRPQIPTPSARVVIGVLTAIGIIIAIVFMVRFVDAVYFASARNEATVEENITREVPLDIPNVASYMGYDDATLEQELKDAGYIIFEISSPANNPEDDLDLFKFPDDVSVEEGALMYARGVSNLTAVDASRILTGSWRFTVERGDTTSMRVRYVDFTSGNLDAALGAAVASQGFDPATATSSGTDSSGNLFQEGTVVLADGRTASWRVAAIELEHVYDIEGLPDSAVYVGIRVTA